MSPNAWLFDRITRTKVILPYRRPDLLSRQRLLNHFYDQLDNKLIIIAAPAGYGKTSLLVDVAHQIDLPVCWYAIDALDSDPRQFFTYFIAAIAHRFPVFGQKSAAVLESINCDSAGLDRLVTVIVNEIYQHIQEHFLVVLDDYHLVDNAPINGFINRFVQQVDENCHLVLSSRKLLRLPDLVLLVGRSQVGGMGLNDLAFQIDEVQELILQNYNQSVPDGVAKMLVQESEGWITGLLLSAQTIWSSMVNQLRVARVSGVGLYDYLAQQVLEQQPPEVQDFLLRTALLKEFDAQLCAAVLGPPNYPGGQSWPELIETVAQNNLFVLPVGDGGRWLRYHHLFQEFLQSKMETGRPQETRRILGQLAAEYTRRKAWDKAHHLYRRLDDAEAIACLIEQAGLAMVESGWFTTLGNWIDALPGPLLNGRPLLLALRGYVAAMLGQVRRGLDLLNRAETAFRAKHDVPNLTRTLVWRAGVLRLLGQYQPSLADAEAALALVENDDNRRSLKAEALRAKGQSLRLVGQPEQAIEYLEQSLQAFKALNDTQNVSRLLTELGVVYHYGGHYERAQIYYNRAFDHLRRAGSIIRLAELLNNLGALHQLTGNYRRAASVLEEALDYTRQSNYARFEAFVLCGIGDLYAALDALDAAGSAYNQAHAIARRLNDRFLQLYLHLAQAMLVRQQGQVGQARQFLELARQRIESSTSPYEQGLYYLAAGRLALAQNRAETAIDSLQSAIDYFDRGGQQIERACTYLYLAMAYHTMGDTQAMAENVEQLFDLAGRLQNQHPVVVSGREAVPLLEAMQDDADLGCRSTQFLAEVAKFEQQIPLLRRHLRRQTSAVPFAPPRLTIQALGRGRVLLDGQPVTGPEWQTQRRVRELFFYLLSRPNGLSREAIGAVFWPESNPGQLKLQFKNTVYRLRRALDKDVVVYNEEEDRYYFNRQLDYEYDVEIFQQQIDRAQAASTSQEWAAACQAAIELYHGPYLPRIDGTWVWPERERLKRTYLEANLALIGYYLERGQYRLALKYCYKALAEEPCQEEVHRLAMRSYAALGNRAGIIRQFEQCKRTLKNEIDAPVSPQTRRLYRALLR